MPKPHLLFIICWNLPHIPLHHLVYLPYSYFMDAVAKPLGYRQTPKPALLQPVYCRLSQSTLH
ncbi:MAG: hypothetical protein SFZ02_04125 [bacterium]|nr:hypothetical protein [bacterium]